jgi:GT2 family glycosyltransferase
MTASRNLGLEQAVGDVVAYVDDDAYAVPDWAGQILLPYCDPTVGAVGGQALNGIEGERNPAAPVGKLTPWGEVIGNFGADIGGVIDVDHLMGCNMSFRRDLLARLGGFIEFYPNGRCSTFEEVDLCLRIRRLGLRVVYNSSASVLHEGAPRRVGARGDINYIFGATRNLLTVLVRDRGVFSPIVPAFIGLILWRSTFTFVRDFLRALVRFLAAIGGIPAALIASPTHLVPRADARPHGAACATPSPDNVPRQESRPEAVANPE